MKKDAGDPMKGTVCLEVPSQEEESAVGESIAGF